jgi:transmembrane 9 superfamily protein 2/4
MQLHNTTDIFLYSIQYFYTRLEMDDPYSAVTYFVYMALLSFAFSVLTGTIGYYSCDWFVRKIYSSIKID